MLDSLQIKKRNSISTFLVNLGSECSFFSRSNELLVSLEDSQPRAYKRSTVQFRSRAPRSNNNEIFKDL